MLRSLRQSVWAFTFVNRLRLVPFVSTSPSLVWACPLGLRDCASAQDRLAHTLLGGTKGLYGRIARVQCIIASAIVARLGRSFLYTVSKFSSTSFCLRLT